jgi:hypothetical protein
MKKLKTATYFWSLYRWQPWRSLWQLLSITGYYLSLAVAGLIAQAFFNHLSQIPGSLSLVMVVSLTLLNAAVAAGGLGLANLVGVTWGPRLSRRCRHFTGGGSQYLPR